MCVGGGVGVGWGYHFKTLILHAQQPRLAVPPSWYPPSSNAAQDIRKLQVCVQASLVCAGVCVCGGGDVSHTCNSKTAVPHARQPRLAVPPFLVLLQLQAALPLLCCFKICDQLWGQVVLELPAVR